MRREGYELQVSKPEVILREVLDEIKIEKIKLQVLKESAELLKTIQKENKN